MVSHSKQRFALKRGARGAHIAMVGMVLRSVGIGRDRYKNKKSIGSLTRNSSLDIH